MRLKKNIAIIITIFSMLFLFSSCDNSKSTNSYDISPTKQLKVHYIDVGQGDSILIQVNDKNLLIDSGPNDSSSKIMNYLSKQNIKKLDYIIATHPHEDHIGNMDLVIKKYNIGEFYAPKKIENTKTFESMVNALNSKKLKITTAKAGLKLDLGSNISCDFLAPNSDKYKDTNNYSVVVKITYGGNSFLFTGDAEKIVEKELLNKRFDLSADVLKIGHHGSTSSSSKEFLDKVSPKVAVISVATKNNYGHPHKETLNELKKRNIQVYKTNIDGNIVLISDGKKIVKQWKKTGINLSFCK